MSYRSIGNVTGMKGLAAPNPQGGGEAETASGFPLLQIPEGSYLNSDRTLLHTLTLHWDKKQRAVQLFLQVRPGLLPGGTSWANCPSSISSAPVSARAFL